MKNQVECNWMGNMSFEVDADDHKIVLDADEHFGGKNRGPRPKILMLVAQAGCTGMDVVAILKKMKVELDSLKIIVEGDTVDIHPKYYKTVHIKYIFKGKDLKPDKLAKAVKLSLDFYCGVSAQLKMGIPLTHEIIIE
jgi:putative redox protein